MSWSAWLVSGKLAHMFDSVGAGVAGLLARAQTLIGQAVATISSQLPGPAAAEALSQAVEVESQATLRAVPLLSWLRLQPGTRRTGPDRRPAGDAVSVEEREADLRTRHGDPQSGRGCGVLPRYATLPRSGRVAGGVSAPGSHRSVRESLDSYGSCRRVTRERCPRPSGRTAQAAGS
jgi:hypothetical protein